MFQLKINHSFLNKNMKNDANTKKELKYYSMPYNYIRIFFLQILRSNCFCNTKKYRKFSYTYYNINRFFYST